MKYLKYIYIFFLIGALFACQEDELDPKLTDDVVAPSLTAPADTEMGEFVLEKVNESQDFMTIEWTDADFKLDVVTFYNLEIDVKGGAFDNRKIITSNITSPFTITVSDFNKGLLANGFIDGEKHEISLRVVANHTLSTETINMSVTPYFDVEPWSIIGSAVGGWEPENDIFMEYDKEREIYFLTLDLAPGKYKFRAPKININDPWEVNLGLDGNEREVIDENNVVLSQGGSDILTIGGNYTIELDVENNTFSITQNSAPDLTDWTGVVLDAVGDGISADNPNASPDGSSWGWGNVILADNEGKPTENLGVYTWTWEGIVLEAASGFKIRTLNGEPAPENGIGFDVGFGAVDTENSTDKVVDDGGNITVSEKGTYNMTITIDALNGDVKTVTIKEPNAVKYLVGAGVPAAGWGWDTPVEVIETEAGSGVFVVTTEFANEAFRVFDVEGDWGSGKNYPTFINEGYTIDPDFEDAQDNDNNFSFIGTPGNYTFTIDTVNKTITLD
jgi:hypothetical protein